MYDNGLDAKPIESNNYSYKLVYFFTLKYFYPDLPSKSTNPKSQFSGMLQAELNKKIMYTGNYDYYIKNICKTFGLKGNLKPPAINKKPTEIASVKPSSLYTPPLPNTPAPSLVSIQPSPNNENDLLNEKEYFIPTMSREEAEKFLKNIKEVSNYCNVLASLRISFSKIILKNRLVILII